MFGLKSNCELVYAWIGAFAGLLVSFAIPLKVPPVGTSGWLWGGLLLGAGAALLVSLIFRVFYRQRFFALFLSTLIGAMLIGLLVMAIASVVTLTLFVMALMFAVGALVGQFVGRLLCAACLSQKRRAPWATSHETTR